MKHLTLRQKTNQLLLHDVSDTSTTISFNRHIRLEIEVIQEVSHKEVKAIHVV